MNKKLERMIAAFIVTLIIFAIGIIIFWIGFILVTQYPQIGIAIVGILTFQFVMWSVYASMEEEDKENKDGSNNN